MRSPCIYPKESNRIAKAELVKAGGEVVGDEYAALGTTEFITIINKIKQARPDFVLSNLVGDKEELLKKWQTVYWRICCAS